MNSIDSQTASASSAREAFNFSSGRTSRVAPDKGGSASNSQSETTVADRTVNDTVTLSDGAQKIVNLNRGQSLADDLRSAPVDENFAANLEHATNDVFRISELFNKTVRAAFSLWR